jgi:hypothetical protein
VTVGHPHTTPPASGPAIDGHGIPLAVSLTDGNRNDVTQLVPSFDKFPAVAGRSGRPCRRPDVLLADHGCTAASSNSAGSGP